MKKSLLLAVVLSLLIPASSQAAFDFVVDKAVTMSNPGAVEGQTVKLYTVVVNNEFTALTGKVNFYNSGQLIGTADIKKLNQEVIQNLLAQVVLSFL